MAMPYGFPLYIALSHLACFFVDTTTSFIPSEKIRKRIAHILFTATSLIGNLHIREMDTPYLMIFRVSFSFDTHTHSPIPPVPPNPQHKREDKPAKYVGQEGYQLSGVLGLLRQGKKQQKPRWPHKN